jgi:hypothetical protein
MRLLLEKKPLTAHEPLINVVVSPYKIDRSVTLCPIWSNTPASTLAHRTRDVFENLSSRIDTYAIIAALESLRGTEGSVASSIVRREKGWARIAPGAAIAPPLIQGVPRATRHEGP